MLLAVALETVLRVGRTFADPNYHERVVAPRGNLRVETEVGNKVVWILRDHAAIAHCFARYCREDQTGLEGARWPELTHPPLFEDQHSPIVANDFVHEKSVSAGHCAELNFRKL